MDLPPALSALKLARQTRVIFEHLLLQFSITQTRKYRQIKASNYTVPFHYWLQQIPPPLIKKEVKGDRYVADQKENGIEN